MRRLSGINAKIFYSLVLFTGVFHVYAAIHGNFEAYELRVVHLGLVLPITFFLYPAGRRQARGRSALPWYDRALIVLSALPSLYVLLNQKTLIYRIQQVDPLTPVQMILGIWLVVVLLEAARRAVGIPLMISGIPFLLYMFAGHWIPGLLRGRFFGMNDVIEHLFLTTEGIFYIPLGVSATFISVFFVFGGFLKINGTADYFMDLTRFLKTGAMERRLLTQSFKLAPVFVFAVLLFYKQTAVEAALGAIAAAWLVSLPDKETRMGIREVSDAVYIGMKNIPAAGIACAVAGIIAGTVTLTGVGFKLSRLTSSLVAQAAWNSRFFVLAASVSAVSLLLFLVKKAVRNNSHISTIVIVLLFSLQVGFTLIRIFSITRQSPFFEYGFYLSIAIFVYGLNRIRKSVTKSSIEPEPVLNMPTEAIDNREDLSDSAVHIFLIQFGLTTRETEVAKQLCTTSLCYKEIAAELEIAENTIKQHARGIYGKTSSTCRVDLMLKLWTEGRQFA